MLKYQYLNQTQKMIVSLAVHIDCSVCASRFLSAISMRSRPYLTRQLSGHTIDTMLSACPLSMHSPSLSIEGHVPTSYCVSTGPSALLTPWHCKIPCALPCARDNSNYWRKNGSHVTWLLGIRPWNRLLHMYLQWFPCMFKVLLSLQGQVSHYSSVDVHVCHQLSVDAGVEPYLT